MLWDTFRDTGRRQLHVPQSCCAHLRHDQRHLGRNGLLDTGRSDWGTVVRSAGSAPRAPPGACIRHENGRGRGLRLLDGLGYVLEDGQAQMLGAGLLGVCAADDLCACSARQSRRWHLRCPVLGCAHTVFDGLCRVEAASRSAPLFPWRPPVPTHVPCFPVKPWNSTLVSPLMRRFLIVWAYWGEPVAYCLVAALESAERSGCRIACIVTVERSREQSCGGRGRIWVGRVVDGVCVCSDRQAATWRDFFGGPWPV